MLVPFSIFFFFLNYIIASFLFGELFLNNNTNYCLFFLCIFLSPIPLFTGGLYVCVCVCFTSFWKIKIACHMYTCVLCILQFRTVIHLNIEHIHDWSSIKISKCHQFSDMIDHSLIIYLKNDHIENSFQRSHWDFLKCNRKYCLKNAKWLIKLDSMQLLPDHLWHTSVNLNFAMSLFHFMLSVFICECSQWLFVWALSLVPRICCSIVTVIK